MKISYQLYSDIIQIKYKCNNISSLNTSHNRYLKLICVGQTKIKSIPFVIKLNIVIKILTAHILKLK